MKIYKFHHEEGIKSGCCNWETTTTYWMAESRDEAKKEIAEETPDWRGEPSGICGNCFARMLAEDEYEVVNNGANG